MTPESYFLIFLASIAVCAVILSIASGGKR